ncbi:AraC family transcriptional regulator [Parabacteroides sp. PF5-9]|uniref:helix-turn-helix domain-containing protein n=1 Tax=Parabacteroides sp. PF5-9 TaxID=1742404 RepID=UPI00247345C6|nr:AraC family transcriptional regulator [Parabacteroides sp. PF5-9]MDH6359083.1 AraC-like DNA-binding protein [Parabacteroides sp. PF5-9]
MTEHRIYIKNMVCNRCIMVVKSELDKLHIHPLSISLGEVVVEEKLSVETEKLLKSRLESLGFSWIDDRKARLIEQIKTTIIELVHKESIQLKINLSDFLSEKLKHDYNYMSTLFSQVEGITIEKYFIAQKIEKVKELLVYNELTLSEIAFKLNYSSTAHLSAQFKKITGFTPSHFKTIKENKRKPLDEI